MYRQAEITGLVWTLIGVKRTATRPSSATCQLAATSAASAFAAPASAAGFPSAASAAAATASLSRLRLGEADIGRSGVGGGGAATLSTSLSLGTYIFWEERLGLGLG